jgi:hypothetical protein
MELPTIPRLIFTDKWNSIWHFVFGKISLKFWLIIPIFLIYQFILYYDYNSIIDTVEFGIGYWYGKVLERVRGQTVQPSELVVLKEETKIENGANE